MHINKTGVIHLGFFIAFVSGFDRYNDIKNIVPYVSLASLDYIKTTKTIKG